MSYLNIFLGLLAKTDTRDKILRFFQYATLHSQDNPTQGSIHSIFVQLRRTRKILRLLGTLQFSMKIRTDIAELKDFKGNSRAKMVRIFTILENLFTVLFYLFDHRVLLGELEIIGKENAVVSYPRSMVMYLAQNIAGALRCFTEIMVLLMDGKSQEVEVNLEEGDGLIRRKGVEFLRNFLDILVAIYLLRKPKELAGRVGVLGMVTSIISILQALKHI